MSVGAGTSGSTRPTTDPRTSEPADPRRTLAWNTQEPILTWPITNLDYRRTDRNIEISAMRNDTDHDVSRLGTASGTAVAALGLAYVSVLLVGFLTLPSKDDEIQQPWFTLMEILIIAIAPTMVVLTVASWGPLRRPAQQRRRRPESCLDWYQSSFPCRSSCNSGLSCSAPNHTSCRTPSYQYSAQGVHTLKNRTPPMIPPHANEDHSSGGVELRFWFLKVNRRALDPRAPSKSLPLQELRDTR